MITDTKYSIKCLFEDDGYCLPIVAAFLLMVGSPKIEIDEHLLKTY